MALIDLMKTEEVKTPQATTVNTENNTTPDYDGLIGMMDKQEQETADLPPSVSISAYQPQPAIGTPQDSGTDLPAYDTVSGKTNLPYTNPNKTSGQILANVLADRRRVGDVNEDDQKLMQTFDEVVQSKKYDSYEGQLNAVANAGYNPARIRQLTEPKSTSSSPYWEEYGLSRNVDMMEYGFKKLWYGGKSLVTDLDAEDQATLDDARKGADSITASSSYMAHLAQVAPEIAISWPMFSVSVGAGTLGVVSTALANATVQGGLTASAIKGETDSSAQAAGWGTAIGGVVGTIGLIPLIGSPVEALARSFMKNHVDQRQLDEMVMALDMVEETKHLNQTQKEVLAFAKINPEGSQGLSDAIVRSTEARKNFIETMMKKEAASDVGIKMNPHEYWAKVYDDVIKQQEAQYTSTQNLITKQLGGLKTPSTELGIDMRMLEFDSSLTEKWLPYDTQTLEKMKAGKSVTLEELQSFRRAVAQQGKILMDEGAKQLGQQFVKLSKDVDNKAIPKLLDSGALPKEAQTVAEGYQDSIKGYAAMNDALRTVIGKKILSKSTEEELQKAVRMSALRKGLDQTTEAQDFVAAIAKMEPKAAAAVEQMILKDVIQASRGPVSQTNKAVAIDWNQVAKDLDKFTMNSFSTSEGKSSFAVMKKIATVSQTDMAILKNAFHKIPTSELAQMGRSALGFNTKLIAMKKAVTSATKFFHSPTAFSHTLEKAMEVKGDNLSEVLFSMQSVGIVPKGKDAKKAFTQAVNELGKIQASINEERNMKFLGYAGEGPISVDGKQFNEVGDLLDAGLLKVNQGDNVAVNSHGKTALVLSDDVSVNNIGKLARLEEGQSMMLEDILDAPKLYEEHPHLKNIKVQPFSKGYDKSIVMGSTNTDAGVINLNVHKDSLTRDFVGAIMHEVGHNVNSVMGVPQATTSGNLKRIVDEKYGGDMDLFLDDIGAPKTMTSYHQLYQSQIDEQFADMSTKGATGNINFSAMEMSEQIGDMADDLGPVRTNLMDERRYLRSKGFKEQAIEEMVPPTPIEIEQKMNRLLNELPPKTKMNAEQLRNWLSKQGVSNLEMEVSGLDNIAGRFSESKTIDFFKQILNEDAQVRQHTFGRESEGYLYDKISYKEGGVGDPTFKVRSQSIGLPERAKNTDMTPTSHQFSDYDTNFAELGHSRVGTQDVNGEPATVLHEIQSDWVQNSRQKGKPFEKDLVEFKKLIAEEREVMDKFGDGSPEHLVVEEKLTKLHEKFPNEELFDYIQPANGDIPYKHGNLFDWVDETDDAGNEVVRNTESGEVWKKIPGGEQGQWEMVKGEAVGSKRPIEPKEKPILNYPSNQKKYVQWQTVEALNDAIESGTNRVVIPIDRVGVLQGTEGVTKAYENMEKPLRDMVKKLKKQGMDIEFNRIVDKAPTTYSKSDKIEKGKIGIELAENFESIVLSNGEDIDAITHIIDEVTTIPDTPEAFRKNIESSYRKFEDTLIEEFGFSKQEAKEQMDMLKEDFDPENLVEKDSRLFEIKVKGKEKDSKQNWDMMAVAGALGLGGSQMENTNEQ